MTDEFLKNRPTWPHLGVPEHLLQPDEFLKNRPTWTHLGVPEHLLQPGLEVMVPAGAIAAAVNGHPSLICYAVVRGRADSVAAAAFRDPANMWWLDVHMAAGVPPLPQMYHRDEILGIPAQGLAKAPAG